MAKNTKKQKFQIGWKPILLLQGIASGWLVFSIFKLDILPPLYLVILVALMTLLCLGFGKWMQPSKKRKKKKNKFFAKFTSLLFSIILMVGCIYVEKGYTALSNIVGANKQITRYLVIVLEDSDIEDIQDLEEKTIHTCFLNDAPDKADEADNGLKGKINANITSAADYKTLVKALYSGEVDAIYMNESFKTLVSETYSSFESDTKAVWTFDIVEEIEDFAKEANVINETFNIYISGIDTTGSISTVSNSDVNMLVTVNPVSKQILLTSIPREYYVKLANYDKEDKLTHAGIAGIKNSVKTIENFMGIEINYYAKVNFTSLETIVDALGGITVDSPYAFTSLHGKYWFDEGLNEMDGHKALCFVRERYALPNGDNDRVKNQQLVIKAMLEKAMSPTIITNYSDILEAVEGAVETNMDSKDIMSLIKMQLKDMSSWTFTSQSLTGTGASLFGGAYYPNEALYYMVPDQNSIETCSNLIKQMSYSNQ